MFQEPEFKSRERYDRESVRILLEDDSHFAELIRAQLRRGPWIECRLDVVGTLGDALAKLGAECFGLIVADLNLTGDQNPALRASAMEHGANDFLSKDQSTSDLRFRGLARGSQARR